MILFPDFLFWVFFLVFFAAVFVAFFIPADTLLKRYNLSFFQRLILGISLGMIMWGWQGYVFGYLNIRLFSYVYLFIFLILWIKFNLNKFKINFSFKFNKFNILLLLIVIMGSIIQLSSVFFTGISKNGGLYFYTYSLTDNLWYMDLTNEVLKRVPPFEPGMSGKIIENYHYWSNLVMAELIRVFHLPFIPTVSQYFSALLVLLLGGTAIVFSQIIKLKKTILIWILFFLYFGGDFVNLIQLIFHGKINFAQKSMEDGAKFLANAPRAFALVLFFAGISFVSLYIKKNKYFLGFLSAFILGSLIGFKVYVGFFGLTGMFFLCIYYLFKKKYSLIIFTVFAIILSLLIYLPVNKNAGGLIYTGFWRSEDFITLPTLGLSHMELAREIYASHNNWLKVLQYDLIFLLIATIGTFGTKIIGIFQARRTLKLLPIELNIFLIPSLMVSFVIGTFFIQNSGGSNAFNFLVSVYVIGSIYAGTACVYWISKINGNSLKAIMIFIIVLLTVPRAVYQLIDNIHGLYLDKGYQVTSSDLKTLEDLRAKTSPSSLILFNPGLLFMNFIVNRPVFLSGQGILVSHDLDISSREKSQNIILKSGKILLVAKELMQNNIDYIYKPSDPSFLNGRYREILDVVYDKNSIQILRVNKIKLKNFIEI